MCFREREGIELDFSDRLQYIFLRIYEWSQLMEIKLTTPDNTFSENIFPESLRSTFSSLWRIPCHRNKTISLGDCTANTNLHGAVPYDLKKTNHSFSVLETEPREPASENALGYIRSGRRQGCAFEDLLTDDISSTFQQDVMIVRSRA